MSPTGQAWRDFESWSAVAAAVRASDPVAASGPVAGRCGLCGCDGVFAWDAAASPRENLACVHCGCIGRQRATAALLLASLPRPGRARVYATEQASPFFVALRRRVGRLRGSEYVASWRRRLRLSAWLWRRGCPAWVRHGDVTALPFADATLDGAVSQDVLEHVDDHARALRELARVLRPGAPLVFTVPFHEDAAHSVRIARVGTDGRVVHDGEPEYHGDPVSGGVLCFHHFGWSLLADLRAAGFSDAMAHRVLDPGAGLPAPTWVLRATR